jgi:hypothetical protein
MKKIKDLRKLEPPLRGGGFFTERRPIFIFSSLLTFLASMADGPRRVGDFRHFKEHLLCSFFAGNYAIVVSASGVVPEPIITSIYNSL